MGVVVRYAAWWLNLQILRPGSGERELMVESAQAQENDVPLLPRAVYDRMKPEVQKLFRHWIDTD